MSSMDDAVIINQALHGYAKSLRAAAKSRRYAGEAWKAERADWRAKADRAIALCPYVMDMVDSVEVPR